MRLAIVGLPGQTALPGRSFLSIELVPRTCWFSNVRSHVSENDWDLLRRMTYAKAGRHCEICGAGPRIRLDAHEVWEYDDERRVQRLENLVALCVDCHRVKHAGLAAVNREMHLVVAHLMQVNDWDEAKAEEYLEISFRTCEERSAHEWTLDLSFLEPYDVHIIAER